MNINLQLRFSSHEAREQSLNRLSTESPKRDKIFFKYGIVNDLNNQKESSEMKLSTIAGLKRTKIITRRRSPHVNKKHRDQFLMSKGNTSLVVLKGKRDKKVLLVNSMNQIHLLQEDLNNKRVGMIDKRKRDIEGRLIINKNYK